MKATDLGHGFTVGSWSPDTDDHYGDGRSTQATDDEVRARDIADLNRALAGIDSRIEELVDRRESGKRDLRKDALDRERTSVLERLQALEKRV